MGLKYVIVNDGALELPIVFSDILIHAEVALRYRNVVGAGFLTVGDNEVNCYGESLSLGVKSRGEVDTKIVNRYLFGNR
jgi:hypothetical protein